MHSQDLRLNGTVQLKFIRMHVVNAMNSSGAVLSDINFTCALGDFTKVFRYNFAGKSSLT